MSIIFRRINRRCRYCFAIVLLCVIFSILTSQWFVYRPSSDHFVESSACPRCFGVHLCPVFATDHVQLSGWQRFSWFSNDYFNIKNIYYGTLEHRPVIFKKLAHQSEWYDFDSCQETNSARCSAQQMTSNLKSLFPCSFGEGLINRFRDAFLSSTDFDDHGSAIALQTTVAINLEPLVLASLSKDVHRLPVPFYYGACGRVIVVSDEGSSLVSYLQSSFTVRAFLARELLISMYELNNAHPDMLIYYPDINLENFVYNQEEKRVKIIDLEYVIIIDRQSRTLLPPDPEQLTSSSSFCRTLIPDFNIQQVCQYILSRPSSNTNEEDMESIDFLHDIPEEMDHRWNLTAMLNRCAVTPSSDERMTLYTDLVATLKEIA